MEVLGFFFIVYIVFQATVLLHELGHAFFGWAAGFRIETIQIGSGGILFQSKWNGVRIRYGIHPFCGYVAGLPKGTSNFRVRRFVFALGGPLVTISVILFMLWIALGPVGAASEFARNCALFLVVMETITILPNLVPSRVPGTTGEIVWNDGVMMLQTLLLPAEAIAAMAEEQERLRIGSENLQYGVLNREYDRVGQGIGAAYCRMLEYGEQQEANTLLRQRLNELEPGEKAVALDSIISRYLALEESMLKEEVTWMMEEALKADPNSATLQGTRGSLLVLHGETDAGIEILEGVLQRATEKSDEAAAAYFLALAHAADRQLERSKEYWDRAFAIDPDLWARYTVEPKIREIAEAAHRRRAMFA